MLYASTEVIFLQVSHPWEVDLGINSSVHSLCLSSYLVLFLCED